MFKDYITSFMGYAAQLRSIAKSNRKETMKVVGNTVQDFYEFTNKQSKSKGASEVELMRLMAELK